MEHNDEVIGDLKELISLLNDGKEGYNSASETTQDLNLKDLFLNIAVQRGLYADELKAHLMEHGGDSENESGGVLGVLHRTWIDIKQAFSSKEDSAILNAIESGEEAAIEKFEEAINDPSTHADHVDLLQRQVTGIREALSQIRGHNEHLKVSQ